MPAEYEPYESVRCAAMLVGIRKLTISGRLWLFIEEFRAGKLTVQRYGETANIYIMNSWPRVTASLRKRAAKPRWWKYLKSKWS
eukprot:7342385-Heterocapsa_arctica.AAC.1